MRQIPPCFIGVYFCLVLCTDLVRAESQIVKTQEAGLNSFLGPARFESQRVYKKERHPNVAIACDGTVLVTLGNSRLLVRRSTDGGKTFGESIAIAEPGFQGGGLTVDETSGDVIAFVEAGHPPSPLEIYRSRDHGITWRRQPTNIAADSLGNTPSMHMNEHGITLRRGPHAGRLLRPARFYGDGNRQEEYGNHYTTAIFSDDGGVTWKTSDPFP